MSVRVGSARIDENGHARGGRAGDQKQTSKPDYKGEVSMQNWYLHSKGWVVLRAKSKEVAEKLAQDMEYACDNPLIGYDQDQRQTLYNAAKKVRFDCSKVKTACETDCSALVRVCLAYAGITVGNIRTSGEVSAIMKTGAFDKLTEKQYTESSEYLRRGDILVTGKVPGHTVIVLDNGAKVSDAAKLKVKKAVRGAKSKDHNLAGLYLTTANLNIRDGAGTRYPFMGVLKRGTKVRCYGYYTTVLGTKWLYVVAVQDDTEYTGFCSSKYLEREGD